MSIPINLDAAKLLFRVIHALETAEPRFGKAMPLVPPYDTTIGEMEGAWNIRPIEYQFSLVMRSFQWRLSYSSSSVYDRPAQIEVNLYRTRMGTTYGFAANWMVNASNFDLKLMEIRKYLIEHFGPLWGLP